LTQPLFLRSYKDELKIKDMYFSTPATQGETLMEGNDGKYVDD
jgi:hypothetical protein